jgi:regulator of nucleoside diphosphate kinase
MNIKMAANRPPIHLIDNEAETLINLALSAGHRFPAVAELLLQELERAQIHRAGALPAHTVSMNCLVEFLDAGNGSCRTVRLVYPGEADITANRISILTPVGVGLIGLRQGHAISWPDRSGRGRNLTVVKVTSPVVRQVSGTDSILGTGS